MNDLDKKIAEKRELHAHAIYSMKDIVEEVRAAGEDAIATPEQQKKIDDYKRKAAAIKVDIDNLIAERDRRKEVDDAVSDLGGTSTQPVTRHEQPRHQPDNRRTEIEVIKRSGALRNFTRCGSFGSRLEAERAAYKAGLEAAAVLFDNKVAQRTLREQYGIEHRALSEGVNTAGGYLVGPEMSNVIIDLREQYGKFRQNCKVVPMGSDSMTVPRRSGGLTAYYTSENTAITESAKTWNQVELVAKKLAALALFSSELDADAFINIGDDLAGEIAYAFALKEDTVGFTGDGTSTSGGVVGVAKMFDNDAETLAGNVNAATANANTFAELAILDLTTLMSKLPEYANDGAKFYCSQVCYHTVFSRLKGTAGGNTPQTLEGMVQPSFLGYPIVITQVLPTSTGDLDNLTMMLFGRLDMAATLGDRQGANIELSRDRYFELDQIAIRGTMRHSINVHDIGDTTTAGPIVALRGAS